MVKIISFIVKWAWIIISFVLKWIFKGLAWVVGYVWTDIRLKMQTPLTKSGEYDRRFKSTREIASRKSARETGCALIFIGFFLLCYFLSPNKEGKSSDDKKDTVVTEKKQKQKTKIKAMESEVPIVLKDAEETQDTLILSDFGNDDVQELEDCSNVEDEDVDMEEPKQLEPLEIDSFAELEKIAL